MNSNICMFRGRMTRALAGAGGRPCVIKGSGAGSREKLKAECAKVRGHVRSLAGQVV